MDNKKLNVRERGRKSFKGKEGDRRKGKEEA